MNSKIVLLKQPEVSIAKGANRCVVWRSSSSSVMLLSSLQLPQPVMLPEDVTLRLLLLLIVYYISQYFYDIIFYIPDWNFNKLNSL